MEAISLTALAQEHLTLAQTASSGRSAHTAFGGHDHTLRQTLIALTAGHALADHESPGEATLHVLVGVVRLTTTTDSGQLAAGEIAVIPDERHGLHALEDCAVLLTSRRRCKSRRSLLPTAGYIPASPTRPSPRPWPSTAGVADQLLAQRLGVVLGVGPDG